MQLYLGTNLGYAVNRYIEPEVWARLTAEEMGLHYVQFVADLLNPSLPDEYIASQVSRIRTACAKYDIKIMSMFTSSFTRVNHFLHPDPEARAFWLDWFKRFADIGAKLGAKNIGSHFGIFTFDSFETQYEELLEEAVRNWQQLSKYAAELGYEYLIFEPMSVDREMGNTVSRSLKLMEMVNQNSAIPLKCCLDVGHAPDPSERDPYPWIEQLGAVSPIIHLQQTVLHKSNHWPFIPEYNEQGIIKPEKVLETLERSGAKEVALLFEIGHREHHDTDYRVVQDLKESADFWKEALNSYAGKSGSITWD